MEKFDKIQALRYLTTNNPLCDNCARADLEELRIAAGLYQLVLEIVDSRDTEFPRDYLDRKISLATTF